MFNSIDELRNFGPFLVTKQKIIPIIIFGFLFKTVSESAQVTFFDVHIIITVTLTTLPIRINVLVELSSCSSLCFVICVVMFGGGWL